MYITNDNNGLQLLATVSISSHLKMLSMF